ncbi:hypothetical protein [Marinomonas epiphytica]
MKLILATLLLLASVSQAAQAIDLNQIDPKTARAYEGYLLTFAWPEKYASEHVDYENVLDLENLLRINQSQLESSTLNTSQLPDVFLQYKQRLKNRVQILSSQRWTLIFNKAGARVNQSFYSPLTKDGYPELVGDISIRLGRYLESDIHYRHYLFDSFSQPLETPPLDLNQTQIEPQLNTNIKQFEPALVLNLHIENKTASKKLNYLDHPIIGTLLYFEPLELETAIEAIQQQNATIETGLTSPYHDSSSELE